MRHWASIWTKFNNFTKFYYSLHISWIVYSIHAEYHVCIFQTLALIFSDIFAYYIRKKNEWQRSMELIVYVHRVAWLLTDSAQYRPRSRSFSAFSCRGCRIDSIVGMKFDQGNVLQMFNCCQCRLLRGTRDSRNVQAYVGHIALDWINSVGHLHVHTGGISSK